MNRDHLRALYTYNARSNQTVLDVVAKLSENEFCTESGMSHSSIQRMLMHMLGVEAYYLASCLEQSLPLNLKPTSPFATIRGEWNRIEQLAKTFIASLTETELREEKTVLLGAVTLTFPIWQMLMQAYTHSTHHRGELSMLLTALGYPVPTLDIIEYFTEQSGQEWPF